MYNLTIFPIISIISIFLLGFSTLNLFRRKHITNLLIALSIWGIVILEIAKFSYIFNFALTARILGLGFCLTIIFWLIASISFLPPKSYILSRSILSPLLGIFSLLFFLIWWIKPFIEVGGNSYLSKLARYFFVLVVFDLSLAISNLERSTYYLKSKSNKLLLLSSLFLLVPYILLSTYAVFFGYINIKIFVNSSLAVLLGGVIFLFFSKEGFYPQGIREDSAVHTSLTLFLIGGYLFFVGAFIKLFHTFGGNLNTLFAFLTTLFVFFVFLFLIFSSSFKQRIKQFLLKHLTRQKYDWQKIWEDFTYKISLVTDIESIKRKIKEAISKIMGISSVNIFIFDGEPPFSKEFLEWVLMYGGPLSLEELMNNDSESKYRNAYKFFKENKVNVISPLYGEKRIIGVIACNLNDKELTFFDKELLKILSLQASSVILNCWAYQKLREAEKKESIYKISSFVIHDVKNYINNLSLLIANKDKFNNPSFREDAIVTLENTIQKMKRLMNEFKMLRGELLMHRKDSSLGKIIEEVIRDLGRERLKNIDLSIDIEDSIRVYADSYYIYKVILNLLLNALEAMNGKGSLKISAESRDGYAYLYIKDTGCGMSNDFIKNRLFKPFNSTKEKGLGIGLYQCKTIIQAHQGDIEVESEINKGTTFKIKLPLSKIELFISK
ncbi:MAG: hypothetical protein J7K17_03815 [Candidatus Omnitrophica bacterium]|nr:hypothetical protein [Candidatus Omnitrophota bacterium]